MNHSNDPILASIKHSKYYPHKFGKAHQNSKKPMERLDTFAQETAPMPAKTKQAGKIRRNSVATSSEAVQKNIQANENAVPQGVLDRWANDELISKIRCSQIASRPEKTMHTALKQTNLAVSDKPVVKRNTRSVSSHYQASYQSLIREYEKKKEKISHQIDSLRSTHTIKVQKFLETPLVPHSSNETPKFGAYLAQSQKIIGLKHGKTPSKAGKDTKFTPFLNAIMSQVELQTALRSLKHRIPKEQQQKVKKLLQTQYKIQEDITGLDNDEFDPFADRTEMTAEKLASELANSHLAAQQNWSKKLKNNFSTGLLNEIFTAFESSSEKGTISLKAFVRQMGILLQNQKYLRNRDLYRIHLRISPFSRENFLSVLGSNK